MWKATVPCFFQGNHNNTVYEKASCKKALMNSALWYTIKYMWKTPWRCVFNIVIRYNVMKYSIMVFFRQELILLLCLKCRRKLKKFVRKCIHIGYCLTWIVPFNLDCYNTLVLTGPCFDRWRETQLYCAQMTVESIQATHIVYNYITFLWTDENCVMKYNLLPSIII